MNYGVDLIKRAVVSFARLSVTGFLLLFFCSLAAFPLAGQFHTARVYSAPDGLADASIRDITQDSRGLMWFAHLKGVSSFDGVTWRNYSMEDGLPSLSISFIKAVSGGKVRAYGQMLGEGFSEFDGVSWKRFPGPGTPDEQGVPIRDVAVLETDSRLFTGIAAGEAGFFILDGASWSRWRVNSVFQLPVIENINAPEANDKTRVSDARAVFPPVNGEIVHQLIAGDGVFFLAAENGVISVDPRFPGAARRLEINAPAPQAYTLAWEKDLAQNGGTLWIAGRQWVGVYRGGQFRLLFRGPFHSYNRPYLYDSMKIRPDNWGGLWISYFHMIRHLVPDNGNGWKLRKFPLRNGGDCFFYDREANLWIGSHRGVSKIAGFCFENYNRYSGMLDDEVSALAEFEDGSVVAGHNWGFSVIRDGELASLALSGEEAAWSGMDRVLDMCRDREGTIWAAVRLRGAVRITPGLKLTWFTEIREISGPYNACASVVCDSQGNVFASSGGAIYQYRTAFKRFTRINAVIPESEPIRRMFAGPDGSVYILTERASIYRMKGENSEKLLQLPNTDDNSFYALFIPRQGAIWVGARRGLFQFDPVSGKIWKYTYGSWRVDNPVYFITRDNNGCYWFGLDNGVMRWDGSSARHFTVTDGLAGVETNRAAVLLDRKGDVWFGMDAGLSRYVRSREIPRKTPPLMEIMGVYVSGGRFLKEIQDRDIKLKPEEDDLSFSFRAISFRDEKSIRYSYRLEGLGEEWTYNVEARDHFVRYTNLEPGDYRFLIRAVNRDGVSSDIASTGTISIPRHFRKSGVYYFFLMALFGGAVFLLIRHIAQRKYASELEKQVEIRASELLAALHAKDLLLKEVHHRVKNNLQIIISLLQLQLDAVVGPEAEAALYANKNRVYTIALIHENLYHEGDLTDVDMRRYTDNLVSHAWGAYTTDTRRIRPVCKVDPIYLDIDIAIPVGLVLTELISNALRHAFPDQGSGFVRVELRKRPGDRLLLQVSDNGTGLPRDFNPRDAETLGLQIVEIMNEQLKGVFTYDGKSGASFTLDFPLNRQQNGKKYNGRVRSLV